MIVNKFGKNSTFLDKFYMRMTILLIILKLMGFQIGIFCKKKTALGNINFGQLMFSELMRFWKKNKIPFIEIIALPNQKIILFVIWTLWLKELPDIWQNFVFIGLAISVYECPAATMQLDIGILVLLIRSTFCSILILLC